MMAFCRLGFLNFNLFSAPEGSVSQRASAIHPSSKSVKRFLRYYNFFDFQYGCHLRSWILKCQNFIGWWIQRAEMHHNAKFQQNWSTLSRYIAPVWFLKMKTICHLAFLQFKHFCPVVSGRTVWPAKQISSQSVYGFLRYHNFVRFSWPPSWVLKF